MYPLVFQTLVGPSLAPLLPPEIFRGIQGIPYVFAVDILPLAAGESLNRDIAIQRDSDFLVVQLNAVITSTDNQTQLGAAGLAPVMVAIQDTGAKRPLQSRPVFAQNLQSTLDPGRTPFYLPLPWLLDRGTTVTVRATNIFTATAVNYRAYYHGIRLYGNRARIRAAVAAMRGQA